MLRQRLFATVSLTLVFWAALLQQPTASFVDTGSTGTAQTCRRPCASLGATCAALRLSAVTCQGSSALGCDCTGCCEEEEPSTVKELKATLDYLHSNPGNLLVLLVLLPILGRLSDTVFDELKTII